MGVELELAFRVVDPKAWALSATMRAMRALGLERADRDGNLVVRSNPYEFVEESPDRAASDADIELAFACGEACAMIFNRPGEYYAMDSIYVLAEREDTVSKITLSTREAKYETYDPGPLFAETMRAFSHDFLKFTVEYEIV